MKVWSGWRNRISCAAIVSRTQSSPRFSNNILGKTTILWFAQRAVLRLNSDGTKKMEKQENNRVCKISLSYPAEKGEV